MEIDVDLEMVGVAVTTSALLDGSDVGVQALGHSVGDAMIEVGQHIGQMTCDQLGHLDHGRKLSVRGPKVPALPEALGPARAVIGPQLAQRFLQRPSARGLQLHRLDRREMLARTLRYVLLAVEPQVLALDQRGIALAEQALVFTLSDLSTASSTWPMIWKRSNTILCSACGTFAWQALM